MRVLLFSDLHGHAFKPLSKTLPDGRNSRLQDAVNVLNEIYHACKQHDIDGVLFGGDLFHARGTLKVPTFNAIFEGIAKIKTRVEFFGMLVGNHDQVTKVGDVHACFAFDSIVTVMDQTQWYTFESEKRSEYLKVFGIPYSTDTVLLKDSLERFGPQEQKSAHYRKICLAHLGISGAKPGSNFVLVSGDILTTVPFTKAGFDYTFLGHYHRPQELTPNMRYIGATHQHNWGDVGQERGYLIYDTESNEAKFWNIISAPRFIKITESTQQCDVENNFIRITPQQQIPPSAWRNVKDSFLEKGARWIQQWVEPVVSRTLSSEEDMFKPGMDIEDMVDSFVEESDIGNLDPEILTEMGKNILGEVQ